MEQACAPMTYPSVVTAVPLNLSDETVSVFFDLVRDACFIRGPLRPKPLDVPLGPCWPVGSDGTT